MELVTLPTQSMFQATPFYKAGDAIVFGLLRPPIAPSPSDLVYEVTAGTENRLDLIAATVYGSAGYWWVIAMANNLIDPQAGLPAGTLLRVPSSADVGLLE